MQEKQIADERKKKKPKNVSGVNTIVLKLFPAPISVISRLCFPAVWKAEACENNQRDENNFYRCKVIKRHYSIILKSI